MKNILESTALKSTGLKKKLSKTEYLKILTHPMLNICEDFDDHSNYTDLRRQLIESAIAVFDLDYLLDVLIASFFMSYAFLKILQMSYIAESI